MARGGTLLQLCGACFNEATDWFEEAPANGDIGFSSAGRLRD
jgi:hypothetical protein